MTMKSAPFEWNCERATTAATTASAKFVPGPASDTNSMSRRPLRSRAGFTGTGLAQPITGTCVSAPSTGRTIEPNGSTCGIGLSVSRPGPLGGVVTEHVRDDAVTDLVQDDRDDQRGEEDDGDAVDVHGVGRRQRRLDAQDMHSRAAGIASSRASAMSSPHDSHCP